jgi:hypothetical protein
MTAHEKNKGRSLGKAFASLGIAAVVVLFSASSCQSTIPNRDPVGEHFPQVVGHALTGEAVPLPLEEISVLLLGYVQDAQFDADRWLIGLLQATPAARILEVPTVSGLFPSMIAETIDSGMRKGIPSEDWSTVVTVYGDPTEGIIELTGNERPRNIRVVLLDTEGRVRWFHDRGFSAGKLLELGKVVSQLNDETSD